MEKAKYRSFKRHVEQFLYAAFQHKNTADPAKIKEKQAFLQTKIHIA